MAKLTSEEIPEKKLKELYDGCGGRRSHYLFMRDEPEEFVDLLVKEKWLKPVNNSSNAPMYVVTTQLIERFRPLDGNEKAQLKALDIAEMEEEREAEIELANKAKQESGETFSKGGRLAEEGEVGDGGGLANQDSAPKVLIRSKSVVGPDGTVYSAVSNAAKAAGVHPTTFRKWLNDPAKKWNYAV